MNNWSVSELKNRKRVLDDYTSFIQIRFESSGTRGCLAQPEGQIFCRTGLDNVFDFDVTLPALLIVERVAVVVSAHVELVSIRVIRARASGVAGHERQAWNAVAGEVQVVAQHP